LRREASVLWERRINVAQSLPPSFGRIRENESEESLPDPRREEKE